MVTYGIRINENLIAIYMINKPFLAGDDYPSLLTDETGKIKISRLSNISIKENFVYVRYNYYRTINIKRKYDDGWHIIGRIWLGKRDGSTVEYDFSNTPANNVIKKAIEDGFKCYTSPSVNITKVDKEALEEFLIKNEIKFTIGKEELP